jgi:hypothetical protein
MFAIRPNETERNGHEPDDQDQLWARRNGEQDASMMPNPRKTHRRQQCEAVFNIFGTAQRHVARYVTENLVSSGTTPAKPPSVRRSARPASRPARSVTASGYVDFTPDNGYGGEAAAISRRSGFRSREFMQ